MVVGLLAACSSDGDRAGGRGGRTGGSSTLPSEASGAAAWIPAGEPAAMAVGPDGSLYLGERRTGRILRVPAARVRSALARSGGSPRTLPATEVARLAVATRGQQGLVGLAVQGDGSLLVGATVPGPPPRQSLLRIRPGAGPPEVVWEGLPATEVALGGRIALLADGAVVMGLGDFGRGPATPPAGSLVRLGPTGPPGQEPVVLSSGWNNPFAFTVTGDGVVWVADNSPGDTAERFGRGDTGVRPVPLTGLRAPSGLVEVSPGRFLVCGYVSERLEQVAVGPDGSARVGASVGPCRLGVVVLPDGSGGRALAVAGAGGVAVRRLP